MAYYKQPWFQLSVTCLLGVFLGSLFLLTPTKPYQKHGIVQHRYNQTAEIKPLLELRAPEPSASVDEWINFALSLDELEYGTRYDNTAMASPVQSWYTIIAKYKPQAIYTLYNRGKIDKYKFNFLLRFGYLRYWDEYLDDVGKVLLENDQAVLTMAYNIGEDETRQRVSTAFFSKANEYGTHSTKSINLNPELLMFAMRSMSDIEKERIVPHLKSGAFSIDPKKLYRLRFEKPWIQEDDIVELINLNSNSDHFTNLEQPYSENHILSGYMTDSLMLGSQRYLNQLLKKIKNNADQPTDYFCAACALALKTDGLIGIPLVRAFKNKKLAVEKNPGTGEFLLLRTN